MNALHRHQQSLPRLAACLFAIVLLPMLSCSGLRERKTALNDTLRLYERAIRWGQHEKIGKFFDAKLRTSIPVELLKNVRISSYTVQSFDLNNKKNHLRQNVEIKYYFLDRMQVKTVIDKQLWTFHKDAQAWLRQNEFPKLQ